MPQPLKILLVICAFAGALQAQFAGPGFLENGGQWPQEVHAAAPIGHAECYLHQSGWTLRLYEGEDFERYHDYFHHPEGEEPRLHGHVVQVELLGGKLSTALPLQPQSGYTHLLHGKQRAHHLQTFRAFQFQEVYPGIHLAWEDQQGQLKYTFKVEASANPEQIQLLWKGHSGMHINQEGQLRVNSSVGEWIEEAPFVYQETNNGLATIESQYQLRGDTLRFVIGVYDPSLPLIIDPNVVFSSYSGATSDNWGFTATYDNQGRLYLGGIGFGFGYPTSPGAFDTIFGGGTEVTLMRFSADGSNREYATFLGGRRGEQPHSLVVSEDELIVFGVTESNNFPFTPTAVDTTFKGGTPVVGTGANFNQGTDLFITRLSADGSQAVGSTYLGGTGSDGVNMQLRNNYGDASRGEVNLDSRGNILIASCTLSADFPNTTGSLVGGGQDGLICKLSPDLTQLHWSAYLGGIDEDAAFSVAEINGEVYITGATASNTFPTTSGTFSDTYLGGSSDGFLSALDSANGNLLNSTYVGTYERDLSFFVHQDPYGNVGLFGQSRGNIPMPAPTAFGDTTSWQFLQLFNPQLSQLLRSTRIGSSRLAYDLAPSAFLIDSCGVTYLSGWGGSLNATGSRTTGLYTSPDAYQSTTDGNDFYLLAIDRLWQTPLYGTFFGGPNTGEHVDGGTSRFSPEGIISQAVCAGCGGTDGTPAFPSTVWSTSNNSSNCNMLGFKIEFNLDTLAIDVRVSADTVCAGDVVDFTLAVTNADSVFWDYGDGRTGSGLNGDTSYAITGDFTVTVSAFNLGCLLQESTSIDVHVIDPAANASLTAQFDPCDSLRRVTFDIQGATDFFLLYTGSGMILDSVPTTVTYPSSGEFTAYLQYSAGGCALELYDSVAVFFEALPEDLQVSTQHVACALPLLLEIAVSKSEHSQLLLDYGDGQVDTGWGNNWSHTYAEAGTYLLRVEATDSICNLRQVQELEVQIGQENLDRITFPNVFTPNGDGRNDVLSFDEALRGWDVQATSLKVFNRWGTEVYSGPAQWDGLCANDLCKEAVYFWLLSWKNSCGQERSQQGFVHLMR